MPQSNSLRALTELDYCVLGVVWREGPISAYGVRMRFQTSVTPAWSSSTGAIYPAIRRLAAAGTIRTGSPTGGRRTRTLEATARGATALRAWLTRPDARLGGLAVDPLRTRIQFITALEPAAVRQFLKEARTNCRRSLKALEELEAGAAAENRVEARWGTLGAIHEARARLEWLDRAVRELPGEIA
jgi:DNA-binding PadR family transcriptional regulator